MSLWSHLIVLRPLALWLLPLALLPWLTSGRTACVWNSLGNVPFDRASSWIDRGLRALATIAIIALVLALAGPARHNESIERVSSGAHVALVIDRSGSMNSTFAGRTPDGGEESKAAASRRLLNDFVARREHDRVGIVAFSTSPMFVLPSTDHRAAIRAAIDAIDQPGLAYTDVARGLAMAFSLFDERDPVASQAILLVSDGAAVIDRRVQEKLRAAFASRPLHLYWLFLRTERSSGIFDVPTDPSDDTPQIMPERHLHLFFQTLGVPYRAFEAESAAELAKAIDTIDQAERGEVRWLEPVPQRDLSRFAFATAAIACLALIAAKLAEVRIGSTSVIRVRG
jgi:mxaC protein